MTRKITTALLAALAAGLIAASTALAAPGFCYPEYQAHNLAATSPAREVTPPGGTLEVSGYFKNPPYRPYYGPPLSYEPQMVIVWVQGTGTIVARYNEMKAEPGTPGILNFRHVFTGLAPGTAVEAFVKGLVFNGYAGFRFPYGPEFQGCSQQSGPAFAVIAGNGAAPLGAAKR